MVSFLKTEVTGGGRTNLGEGDNVSFRHVGLNAIGTIFLSFFIKI